MTVNGKRLDNMETILKPNTAYWDKENCPQWCKDIGKDLIEMINTWMNTPWIHEPLEADVLGCFIAERIPKSLQDIQQTEQAP